MRSCKPTRRDKESGRQDCEDGGAEDRNERHGEEAPIPPCAHAHLLRVRRIVANGVPAAHRKFGCTSRRHVIVAALKADQLSCDRPAIHDVSDFDLHGIELLVFP